MAAADALCAPYNEQLAEITEVRSLEELADQTAHVLRLYEDQLADLDGLRPPAALQDEYAEYLTRLGQRNDVVQAAHRAAAQRKEETVARLFEEGARTAQREHEIAREIGLRGCSALPKPEPAGDPAHEESAHKKPTHEKPAHEEDPHEHR